jgi:hypothetical protein
LARFKHLSAHLFSGPDPFGPEAFIGARLADVLVRRPAGNLAYRRADVRKTKVPVQTRHNIRDTFHQRHELICLPEQGFLGPLAVGDVAGEAAAVDELAVLPQHVQAHQDVLDRAVLAPQSCLEFL